ncbi:DUF2953 domain-containing protein [Thermosediminibacter litoriperuensis]|uniref:DUF2953 family protein n=1 Tax=Thermosediminibacter litoriperuensis TaxID=291989 RepID=A0A5S5AZH3_9FIRM|nr:DUF2953 domain-containing protein [Thermosediminibacter litoriperuensis]TYP59889.1 Protein of unknown function (DUF2953) [Thermosediminibacter litoriperuensis]
MLVLLVIGLTVLLIVLIPVSYNITFSWKDSQKRIYIKISILGLIVIQRNSLISSDAGEGAAKTTSNNYSMTSQRLLRYIFKIAKIKKISLRIKYGFGDPALTGISAGMIWGLAYFVLYRLFNLYNSCLSLDIQPDFSENPTTELYLESIINTRIGHIIIAGLLLLTSRLEHKKGEGSRARWTDILLKTS